MKDEKEKTMLLIIIPAAVVLAIIGLLLWTITSRKSVNICTETSGSFIFSGSRYVFTMEESVAILGMLDAYPNLDRLFADKGRIVWSCFYDYVGDRIFFEISDYIYEYLPEKDKLKKVFDAKKTNVRGVYSAFGN